MVLEVPSLAGTVTFSVSPGILSGGGLFVSRATYEAPLTVEPSGTEVDFSFQAISGRGDLRLRFVPGGSRVSSYGASCGPDLDVYYESQRDINGQESRQLRMAALGVDASWPAQFFVIGINRQKLPIPPTLCPLLTDVVVPFQARPFGGRSLLQINVAGMQQPVGFQVQYLEGRLVPGGEEWRTSEAFQILLP